MINEKIDTSPREVRKFGFLFAGIFGLITGYILYSSGEVATWAIVTGLVFLVSGLFVQPLLRPVFVAWMKFAQILAWINTRIILGIAFYLIVTPMGLMLRLFGKDFLDQRIDRSATTYWKDREQKPFDKEQYERLF